MTDYRPTILDLFLVAVVVLLTTVYGNVDMIINAVLEIVR